MLWDFIFQFVAFSVAANRPCREEIRVMKAKIDFMAANDLSHENVVHFIGAIIDDSNRKLLFRLNVSV